MAKLANYVTGRWIPGEGDGQPLYDAVTGAEIGQTSTMGLDFAQVLNYARSKGNSALRKMTFHERGRMLRALALHLQQHLEAFYALSFRTGATRSDSWIDIEGGLGNLFSYASLRRKFPNEIYALDGEAVELSKGHSFMAQHLLVPKEGVAIHINAFNFPVWGMLEKIAVNLLAGVPAVVKPATITCFLTEAVVREIEKSGILPAGALQLLCGQAGDLLNHVSDQDVVTFTGSQSTGLKLKSNPFVLGHNVPFNMEADSLNCIVLGPDVEPGSADWEIFIREIRKEMTVKAGQKCTAIRRILVPSNKLEQACKDLSKSLAQTRIGNPAREEVRMGPLAGDTQREEVKSQVVKLLASAQLIYGSLDNVEVIDADPRKGAFLSPLLLVSEKPFDAEAVHNVEAFGPVSTLMPYEDASQAVELAKKGRGSLCSTLVTGDSSLARRYVLEAGTYHGRILILNEACAKESTGHGSPLPQLIHGGPGRAGGGEEMGGIRGVKHYMQRVAVQSSPTLIGDVTQVYQPHGQQRASQIHPFRKYFEELHIGDTLLTHKRTITETDIVNFANISWDHFYAHTDHTALDGTLFERPVAHGYLILSAAAGLFVDPAKGPVLLNYGLEDCRFIKPVYAGTTIGVRLTVKEKIPQEKKEANELAKGIVKWYADIFDQTGESVAIATVLTLVKMEKQ